ncbi:hypothetical protein BDV93DRAFT_522862 [Ceratobasidium sp. AG-I]|nr:hypothetical protein BDV93DRAFT_522862 [Ceratobasidium sp. AG-I]
MAPGCSFRFRVSADCHPSSPSNCRHLAALCRGSPRPPWKRLAWLRIPATQLVRSLPANRLAHPIRPHFIPPFLCSVQLQLHLPNPSSASTQLALAVLQASRGCRGQASSRDGEA